MDYLPSLATDLIAELDKAIPLVPPSLNDDDRQIWYKAGRRSVVQQLLTIQEGVRGGADDLLAPILTQQD